LLAKVLSMTDLIDGVVEGSVVVVGVGPDELVKGRERHGCRVRVRVSHRFRKLKKI
jgi:hypothetical protein